MSKGEETRERILARSAQLFNRQGYFGAVMLSNLYKDPIHMERAADHIVRYIETIKLL